MSKEQTVEMKSRSLEAELERFQLFQKITLPLKVTGLLYNNNR